MRGWSSISSLFRNDFNKLKILDRSTNVRSHLSYEGHIILKLRFDVKTSIFYHTYATLLVGVIL